MEEKWNMPSCGIQSKRFYLPAKQTYIDGMIPRQWIHSHSWSLYSGKEIEHWNYGLCMRKLDSWCAIFDFLFQNSEPLSTCNCCYPAYQSMPNTIIPSSRNKMKSPWPIEPHVSRLFASNGFSASVLSQWFHTETPQNYRTFTNKYTPPHTIHRHTYKNTHHTESAPRNKHTPQRERAQASRT